MAGETVEVKAQLTLEDLASEILKQIRGEVEETSEEVKESKSTWKDWAASAAQNLHNLGVNVKDLALDVGRFAESFVDAAAGGESADTALGGLISAVQNIPFDQAVEQAKGLADEIDDIATHSGALGNVEEAFHKLVDFTGATNEGLQRARGNISALSNISGVLGKDVNAITQEYALMQEGTLKVKGQLFQLLQSTGAFGQESKKVAAEWGKLTDEKRAAILESAIDKIAGRFENVPKTFNNWRTSLANLADVAKEQIGEPFMNALAPALEEVTGLMFELKPDLIKVAEAIAGEFKPIIKGMSQDIRDGFSYLKTHKEDIVAVGATIKSAWGVAREVASFILAHKEELAIAFGAKTVGDGLGSAVALGGQAKKAFGEIPGALNKSVGAINAFTVALGVAVLAGYELGKALQELKEVETENNPEVQKVDAIKAAREAAAQGNVSKVDSIRETQRNLARGRGVGFELDESTENTLTNILDMAKIVKERIGRDSKEAEIALRASSKNVGDALRASGQEHYNASGTYADKVLEATASKVVAAYNQAIANGDMAAAAYAANMINGSVQLQEAFLQSGLTIEGGIDQFANMLITKSTSLSQALSSLSGGNTLGGKTSKNNVFMAGSTGSGSVNIKVEQNFRNADPDRVAYAFQRDIKKSAERRYQSSSSSPFG